MSRVLTQMAEEEKEEDGEERDNDDEADNGMEEGRRRRQFVFNNTKTILRSLNMGSTFRQTEAKQSRKSRLHDRGAGSSLGTAKTKRTQTLEVS